MTLVAYDRGLTLRLNNQLKACMLDFSTTEGDLELMAATPPQPCTTWLPWRLRFAPTGLATGLGKRHRMVEVRVVGELGSTSASRRKRWEDGKGSSCRRLCGAARHKGPTQGDRRRHRSQRRRQTRRMPSSTPTCPMTARLSRPL
jgi:hypothetical protein